MFYRHQLHSICPRPLLWLPLILLLVIETLLLRIGF